MSGNEDSRTPDDSDVDDGGGSSEDGLVRHQTHGPRPPNTPRIAAPKKDFDEEEDGEPSPVRPIPRPAPVGRASTSGSPSSEPIGELPPPTEPGSTMRAAGPPTPPPQGSVSLANGGSAGALSEVEGARGALSPPDPSDATGIYTKEDMQRVADEDEKETPNPNASALLDQPNVEKGVPAEPPQDDWYNRAPAAPIPVEAQWVDDEPVLTSASDRRPFYIGVGLALAAIVCLVVGGLAFTGGGLGLYAWLGGGGQGSETAVAAMPPIAPDPILVVPPPVPEPEPEKAPEEAQAPVTTSHEYFVAVSPQTVLATVNVGRKAFKCTIVEYEETAFTAANLEWPNLSHYERWEICAPDLRKGPSSDGGGFMLIAGDGEGTTINLKEVIATEGGADYTALTSTPGALARCWGSGQVNGGGQPTCTKKPPQVAENAPAATLPAVDKQ